MFALRVECCRPRNSPSAPRCAGSRTITVSSFAPGRWYANRTYSPFSISECAKSMSLNPSMFELVGRSAWSTIPSPFASLHSLPSWLTSFHLYASSRHAWSEV